MLTSDLDKFSEWFRSSLNSGFISDTLLSWTTYCYMEAIARASGADLKLREVLDSVLRGYDAKQGMLDIDRWVAERLSIFFNLSLNPHLAKHFEVVNTLDLVDLAISSHKGAIYLASPLSIDDASWTSLVALSSQSCGCEILDPWQ